MNRPARQACLLGTFAAALGWLLWRGPLAVALRGPSPTTRAVLDADAVVVRALDVLRLTSLVGCGALVALAVLHAVAAWSGARVLQRLARAVTPHALRPFLGVVTVATFAAPVAAGAANPPTTVPVTTVTSPPPTMRRIDITPSTTATTSSSTTTIVAPTTTIAVADVAVVSPVHPKARATEPAPPPPPATWTVQRGEHLWYVAEQVMTRALGRAAAEAETAPYWLALIDANRDRFVDPENPDLVHAGLELVLPDVTGHLR